MRNIVSIFLLEKLQKSSRKAIKKVVAFYDIFSSFSGAFLLVFWRPRLSPKHLKMLEDAPSQAKQASDKRSKKSEVKLKSNIAFCDIR